MSVSLGNWKLLRLRQIYLGGMCQPWQVDKEATNQMASKRASCV